MGPGLFRADALIACELTEADVPALQGFFNDNPEYFITVNGAPPRSDEALQEFNELPPKEMPFTRHMLLGFVDDAGSLVGMATVLSDFLAQHVWHIGLFILATRLHGTGTAVLLYSHLEHWMKASGANWLRLGAVVGNLKAERFWEKAGYAEVRQRSGIQTGDHTSTVRVFAKPLQGGSIEEYLQLIERDRPESTLP